MKFLPFREAIKRDDALIVDAYHKNGKMFSHWKGANTLAGLQADTSTGIVLNALRSGHAWTRLPYVSNNHFDVDGFLGIWALLHPDLALKHADALEVAAKIGDFREFQPDSEIHLLALKWVCWINAIENSLFYEPFGAKDEHFSCIPKYEWFLNRFSAIVSEPHEQRTIWEIEYLQVLEDVELLQQGASTLMGDIRLKIIKLARPVHYYALFSRSEDADMVLSIYDNQQYELEYKYTSWVDTADRLMFPRLPFDPLVERLNQIEQSVHHWFGDPMMDTGPMLRLTSAQLTKAQRFDHPSQRYFHCSSIREDDFKAIVIDYLRTAYQGIVPKNKWSWREMREVAERKR